MNWKITQHSGSTRQNYIFIFERRDGRALYSIDVFEPRLHIAFRDYFCRTNRFWKIIPKVCDRTNIGHSWYRRTYYHALSYSNWTSIDSIVCRYRRTIFCILHLRNSFSFYPIRKSEALNNTIFVYMVSQRTKLDSFDKYG